MAERGLTMNKTDIIVALIVLAIAAAIITYLVRAKKRGEKCIGCPYAKQCGNHCNCNNNAYNGNSHH